MAAPRNRDGIQFAAIRDGFDQRFEAVHDALEVAYYQHWRQGEAHAMQIGDLIFNVVNGTPRIRRVSTNNLRTFPSVTPKQFFDRLHARIWRMYTVQFHARVMALPDDQRPQAHKYDVTEWQARADADQAELDADGAAGFDLEIPEIS